MSKVCSDLEWKVEVDAEQRIKRKAATQRSDATAAKRDRRSSNDNATQRKDDDGDDTKKKPAKLTIKRIREQRRIQARKIEAEKAQQKSIVQNNLLLVNHPGHVVAPASSNAVSPQDFFWEVEDVIGRRIHRGRVEYLIRWKGCTENDNTWEPHTNLCDTAMELAVQFTKQQKLLEKQREEDEKKLFGPPPDKELNNDNDNNKYYDKKLLADDVSMDSVNEEGGGSIQGLNDRIDIVAGDAVMHEDSIKVFDETESPPVDDHIWKWSDADQVTFREVERINVNDFNSSKVVTQARISGTPLVLVGHVGWANFAKRWLVENKVKDTIDTTACTNASDLGKSISNDCRFDDLLDLSKDYELDVNKMINDIGEEDVPVIKRNYNEQKPIHGRIAAKTFLMNCWLQSNESKIVQHDRAINKSQKNTSSLYLHQWQFPLSDTAGRKLCHHNNPLPKGVMGADLLRYWLDLPQCQKDSPLQYIFMGREDTLSKLHKDPGGLEISIAPIVGEKECILVHRDDGSNCMYNLTASLEDIDLHKNPLLFQARIWKTVIKPGEILLMPNGTYHQCRNITPCLSYSRFHLDTVNLLPFVQSLVNGDAPEIDHEEIIWNMTTELIDRVDKAFDRVQARVKAGLDEGDIINDEVVDSVNILRTLRHYVREVARREEICHLVKGVKKSSDEHDFSTLVDDVDMCLHEFRYRQSKIVPPFKQRKGKAITNIIPQKNRKSVITRDKSKFCIGSKPIVAFSTSLENNYTSIHTDIAKHFPRASEDKIGETLVRQLVPGDKVSVKLVQKHVKAEILEIIPQMNAAYLSFEDFPSIYDEYQPFDLLMLPSREEIPVGDIKPGLLVLDFSNTNEYRARIQSTVHGTMARVKMTVSEHQMVRLISPDMILGRYIPPVRRSKKKYKTTVLDTTVNEEMAPPIEVLVGQVVQKYGRGAAVVTGIHSEESSITHVDLRYLIGRKTTESMVPIEKIQLAPELNVKSCPVALVDLTSESSDVDESGGRTSNFSDIMKSNQAQTDCLTSESSDVDKSGGDVDKSGGDVSNFSDDNTNESIR